MECTLNDEQRTRRGMVSAARFYNGHSLSMQGHYLLEERMEIWRKEEEKEGEDEEEEEEEEEGGGGEGDIKIEEEEEEI